MPGAASPGAYTRTDAPRREGAGSGGPQMTVDAGAIRRQNGRTGAMTPGAPIPVSHLGEFLTRKTGDATTTGKSPRVGPQGRPRRRFREGDVMRLGIAAVGRRQERVPVAAE